MASEGIEFLMELTAKLEGAAALVNQLTKAEKEALAADEALKKVEKTTTLLGKAMQGAKGAFHGAKDYLHEFGTSAAKDFTSLFAAEAAWDGVKEGVHLVMELGEKLIDTAAEAERTELSFKNMLGETAGGELLEYLDGVAKHTEFTDGALKGFAQQLTDAGYAGEGMKDALAATLDVASRYKNKMEGASAAVGALERIQLTGTLDNRVLRALKLSPKTVFTQMAKDLGIGQKELEKKLQAGKVKTEDVVNSVYKALASKSGRPLGAVGADMADTLGARIEKVKDILPNLFEELSKSKGIQGISGFLGKLADAFDPASPTGKKVVGGLDSMVTRLGGLVAGIDLDKWAGRAVMAMDFFAGAVEVGVMAIDEFFRMWEGLNAIGEALGGFVYDTQQAVTGAIDWLGELLSKISQFPAAVLAKALDIGNALWQGIRDGITGGITYVTDAVSGMGDAIVGKLKGVLGIHSPSKVFEAFGSLTAQGFSAGLDLNQAMLEGSVENAFTFEPPSLSASGGVSAAAPSIDMPSLSFGAQASMGDVSLSVPITVNMDGAAATADEVAARISAEVPTAILAALEQLGLQGGLA